MGWFSILPDNLSSFETFIARVFVRSVPIYRKAYD